MSQSFEDPQNESHLMAGYSGIFFGGKQEEETSGAVAGGSGEHPVKPMDKRKMVVAGSLLVLAAIVVIFAGIKAAQIVVAPFFMACFLAIVLTAPLRWFKSKGFSDLTASLIIIVGVLIFGISIIWILSGSVNRFIARIPEYTEKTNKIVEQIDDLLEPYGFSLQGGVKKRADGEQPKNTENTKNGELTGELKAESRPPDNQPKNEAVEAAVETAAEKSPPSTEPKEVDEEPKAENNEASEAAVETTDDPLLFAFQSPLHADPVNTVGIAGYARIVMKELGRLATLCFIVMILVVFMMLEASRLPKKILISFGTNGMTNDHLQAIVDKVWKYMIIKSIISFFVGSLVWLMLVIADVDYAMLWGLLAFFLNFIPNIGSIAAAIPGIALALFDHGFGTCFAVTVGYFIINQGLGYYVEPIWLGDGLGISPLVILLSLIFFGYLLGMIGMFLSAPLAIVMKIVCDSFEETRWVGTLMSDK